MLINVILKLKINKWGASDDVTAGVFVRALTSFQGNHCCKSLLCPDFYFIFANMKKMYLVMFAVLLCLCSVTLYGQETARPKKGEGISLLLQRFNRTKKQHYDLFLELNKGKFTKDNGLKLNVDYILPPLEAGNQEPLFGKKLAKYKVESQELSGACFYLVSGHGGPDPGAIGIAHGKQLHEDEYAYDIVLRLARNLLMKGAKVHIIIQDEKDGIRDDKYLSNSSRETCMGATIPLNQVERLRQRCDKVNSLYAKDKESYRRAAFVHVDSRGKGQQIDVFFYHCEGSEKGKRLANTIRDTFNKKYDKHQPNRGFEGTVSARNLYVLRNTKPVSVFLELGNIQNKRDLQRLIIPDNRQALANWICEGMVKDYQNEKKNK